MTPTTKSIIALAAQRVPQAKICQILSVAPSTVSEVISENAEAIKNSHYAQSQAYEREATLDDNLLKIEEVAVERLLNSLPLVDDPMKVLAIFSKINAAKRHNPVTTTPDTPEVAVNLPKALLDKLTEASAPQHTTNANSAIVEVNGEALLSADTSELVATLKTRKGKELLNELPNSPNSPNLA